MTHTPDEEYRRLLAASRVRWPRITDDTYVIFADASTVRISAPACGVEYIVEPELEQVNCVLGYCKEFDLLVVFQGDTRK